MYIFLYKKLFFYIFSAILRVYITCIYFYIKNYFFNIFSAILRVKYIYRNRVKYIYRNRAGPYYLSLLESSQLS